MSFLNLQQCETSAACRRFQQGTLLRRAAATPIPDPMMRTGSLRFRTCSPMSGRLSHVAVPVDWLLGATATAAGSGGHRICGLSVRDRG
jgi:hypothetical protein